MSLRNKLLLWFVLLGCAPALGLCAWAYLSGAGAVEGLLRAQAEGRAGRVARGVEDAVEGHRGRLHGLARGAALRDFVSAAGRRGADEPAPADAFPEAARGPLEVYVEGGGGYIESLTGFDPGGRPLFRLKPAGGGRAPELETENLVTGVVRPDERVWREAAAVVSPPRSAPDYGSSLLVSAPVPAGEAAAGGTAAGALVLELRLADLVAAADAGAADAAGAGREVVALDNGDGLFVYHNDPALRHRAAEDAAPHFAAVARRMRAGESGAAEYATAAGERWLASLRQVRGLPLSLAAAENYTAAAAPVRGAALAGFGLALAAGLAGVALLYTSANRAARDHRRLALGLEAVERGDLSARVETEGLTAEARPLGEGFNRMTDRLRAHVTTTSETKQFESFMRLSAILSHDLKNAVAGLSLLVSNMEKHLHREEFRAQAVSSLTHATEKLRRLAARLTEPAKSLSGEYRRESRQTDLVAVIRRVLAANVEPHGELYELRLDLPDQLVATVEPDRIENVVENLVINGVEAMGAAGGRLTVEAGRLDDGLLYFSVADTGVGMAPEFLRARLYRPFATTKQRGLGLGLYTCREVVEAHGGRLEVESRLGAGTRFRVVLPSSLFTSADAHTRPPKGAAAAAAPAEPGS